ncbi:2-nitropropane dioxygenase [Prescottella equi]|uniref:NAD(P)H-dependent flavin oxidoreductase n=1 Tax=Rhodococcus hoagii TaxID=43767 RepID=UPI000A100312|nr:nitronate monooxygenase [Prescottella equi]MBM4731364.1 nitronate monooxygenase [Prescottella equi]NKR56952.1 nitronate monooxygenase [Prescottella equi]ORL03418.1 2-nitropropane dioxygenase [Prescottella equi]BCN64561.1 2-nitropropane dioxygenase [Prescottella equi]BCN74410.1 2-nitropropane dioxygenase [Prescottella equi]
MIGTWLTRELGLEVPIFGAPMGGRAGGRLAGEVTRAGGLGLLGAARYATPDWIAEESATAREIGGGLLGIGLMTWSLDADDSLLDAALAERPRVVSLSFGDPAPYVERVHAAGALAVSQVNTLDDLHVVERAGVDFVIAQGGEAGGHTGRIGTLPLLQEVLDATSLPVLAAGGIGTGRGLAAVIAAGAEGAMIGTALLASPETIGPEYARRKLIEAGSADTVYTSIFDQARDQPWPARWGGRALANDYTAEWHGRGADNETLAAAYDPADATRGVVYAGEAAGLVTTEQPAGDVVRTIAADAERLLRRTY